MFNLGSNSKKKATNVKLEQYEQGSGPSTQPIIPVRKPKEKSPGPSANAAANRGSRRRTMLREDFASTQPVTIREATQAQKRSAALNEAELSYLTSFKQPRLSMDPPPHRQGHQQRAYASDNLPNADAARDTRPNYDERRKNIQDERNKMYEDRIVMLMTRLKEMAEAKDREDIVARYKEKEKLMDKAYEDMQKCIQDLQSTKAPGDTGQAELVTSQQEEINGLKAQVQELQAQLSQMEKPESDLMQELELYKSMTGLLVEHIELTRDDPEKELDAGKQFTCLMKNELGELAFNLIFPFDKSKRIVYIPLTESQAYPKLWDSIPYWLHQDIDFDKEDLPVFFWRLSSTIHFRK